jgi:hypothetical protein
MVVRGEAGTALRHSLLVRRSVPDQLALPFQTVCVQEAKVPAKEAHLLHAPQLLGGVHHQAPRHEEDWQAEPSLNRRWYDRVRYLVRHECVRHLVNACSTALILLVQPQESTGHLYTLHL